MKNIIMSEEEFQEKYTQLLIDGFQMDSPEMLNLFRLRMLSKQTQMITKLHSEEPQQPKQNTKYLPLLAEDIDLSKAHIIVDHRGNYYMLDKNLRVVAQEHSLPISNFLKRKFNLIKFRITMSRDLRMYKKTYKRRTNPEVIRAYKDLKLFLKLCPDADYQILKLLKDNITIIDTKCPHYFVACAEYLDELSSDYPDINNIPFNLNYLCEGLFDDLTTGYHRCISNILPKSDNPVQEYQKTVSRFIPNYTDTLRAKSSTSNKSTLRSQPSYTPKSHSDFSATR